MRRQYDFLILALVALVFIAGTAGAWAGRKGASKTKVVVELVKGGRISTKSTRKDVEALFNLGTNARGVPQYTRTACTTGVCAWVYDGDGYRVVLYLDTEAAPPHGPPPTD